MTFQLLGITGAIFLKNVYPLLTSTIVCNMYLFFEFELFRKKGEVIIALTITMIASLLAKYTSTFFELATTPFIIIVVIILARKVFLILTNKEPETAARGYSLIKQRDRTYSWIVINILLFVTFVAIIRPWKDSNTKFLWIPALIFGIQLPIIVIFLVVKYFFLKRNSKRKQIV